jgi:WD40 repeat protein
MQWNSIFFRIDDITKQLKMQKYSRILEAIFIIDDKKILIADSRCRLFIYNIESRMIERIIRRGEKPECFHYRPMHYFPESYTCFDISEDNKYIAYSSNCGSDYSGLSILSNIDIMELNTYKVIYKIKANLYLCSFPEYDDPEVLPSKSIYIFDNRFIYIIDGNTHYTIAVWDINNKNKIHEVAIKEEEEYFSPMFMLADKNTILFTHGTNHFKLLKLDDLKNKFSYTIEDEFKILHYFVSNGYLYYQTQNEIKRYDIAKNKIETIIDYVPYYRIKFITKNNVLILEDKWWEIVNRFPPKSKFTKYRLLYFDLEAKNYITQLDIKPPCVARAFSPDGGIILLECEDNNDNIKYYLAYLNIKDYVKILYKITEKK